MPIHRNALGSNLSLADRRSIEAATPGWHWSKGYRAPKIIIRRGEGTNVTAWRVVSLGQHTEVTVKVTNGVQVIQTLARHVVASTELPALARELIKQYHQ